MDRDDGCFGNVGLRGLFQPLLMTSPKIADLIRKKINILFLLLSCKSIGLQINTIRLTNAVALRLILRCEMRNDFASGGEKKRRPVHGI